MTITRITYWTDDGQSQSIEGDRVAARAASVFALYAEQETTEAAGSQGAKWARDGNERLDHELPPKPPTVLWTGHLPRDPITTFRLVVKDMDEDDEHHLYLVAERQGSDAMGDRCWYTISSDRSAADTRRIVEAALLSLAQDLGLVAL